MASVRSLLRSYANWIHLQFPGGRTEKLPQVDDRFRSSVEGVYVVGDLAGVPLLKYSIDSGVRAVRDITADGSFVPGDDSSVLDIAIIGAGAAGMAAAREAASLDLSTRVIEASQRFATIRDFQIGKPIYTYPREMTPAGTLQVQASVKEELVEELEVQTADVPVQYGKVHHVETDAAPFRLHLESGAVVEARRVIVAIGRSGSYRRLDVRGEEQDHVHHRLYDPGLHTGEHVVVVGGGDSAVEAAVALAEAGAQVTLSYRRKEFVRPKEENLNRLREVAAHSNGRGRLMLRLESEVAAIDADTVQLTSKDERDEVPADAVYVMIGREIAVDFFRRSGLKLKNDWGDLPGSLAEFIRSLDWLESVRWGRVAGLAGFLLFMAAVYSWKDGGWLERMSEEAGAFPFSLAGVAEGVDPTAFGAVLLGSMQAPAFYYTLAYSLIVVIFGYRRIVRRKTPYVFWQTVTLASIQVLPLFILPEMLLPWAGANEWISSGTLDALFPLSEYSVHGREYWRAYGFILAWPLLVYNVFTTEPLWWWLGICFVQTFVLIPAMIYYWGKGSYCGWICSCGAMAETLGDTHREKMPHGEGWNRFNLAGQVIMVAVFVLLVLRIVGWIWPGGWADGLFSMFFYGQYFGMQINYSWMVDVVLAGMIGYGVIFWLSGRFWCRFLCPLAALMHIYTRFSRFRIFAEKEKCISCNACTSVCHQGIDVMDYAQQGIPMDDPQCVRCSACVQTCPTGVLSFGQIDRSTGQMITVDELEASLTRIEEQHTEQVRA